MYCDIDYHASIPYTPVLNSKGCVLVVFGPYMKREKCIDLICGQYVSIYPHHYDKLFFLIF